MSRCQIHGETRLDVSRKIYAPEYSISKDGLVRVCRYCFELIVSDKHAEIRELIAKKLRGEGYDFNE